MEKIISPDIRMKPEVASTDNNKELIDFHSKFILKGQLDIKIDRMNDFFSYYKAHSDQYRVYYLRDSNTKEIEASASFIFQNCLYKDKIHKIAYATDLRVSSSRKALIDWSKSFLPVIEELKKDFNIDALFSIINLADTASLNTLVRPRNIKRPMPRYYLYRKFNMVSLHGRFPFYPRPLKTIRIEDANQSNIDALVGYLTTRNQYRPFSSIWDHDSFKFKITRDPSFDLSNFLIAKDLRNNVIGCIAMWNSSNLQSWVPLTYSLRAHNFRQFLKFGQLLGWSRSLTKPVTRTKQDFPFNFQWLKYSIASNEDVFDSLLQAAFERSEKNQFLVYAHCEKDFKLFPPKHWIHTSIPLALYSVFSPNEERPSFLDSSETLNPEIDFSLFS